MTISKHIPFIFKALTLFIALNVISIAIPSLSTQSAVYAQKKSTTKKTTAATKSTAKKSTAKKSTAKAKPIDKKTQLKNEQAATQRKRQQSQQQIQAINRNIKANLDSMLIIDHRISRQVASIDSMNRAIRELSTRIDTLNAQITRIKAELKDKKAGGTVQFDVLLGRGHRDACDNAYNTKRLKWLFSQVKNQR